MIPHGISLTSVCNSPRNSVPTWNSLQNSTFTLNSPQNSTLTMDFPTEFSSQHGIPHGIQLPAWNSQGIQLPTWNSPRNSTLNVEFTMEFNFHHGIPYGIYPQLHDHRFIPCHKIVRFPTESLNSSWNRSSLNNSSRIVTFAQQFPLEL